MSLFNLLKFITNHPLNRNNKINAVARFLRWQLGSRLIPGDVVYEWVNGSRFFVRRGESGLTGNIYCGLHEFHDMAFLLHVLRSDDLFIDVGANSGSYTILACAAVGARGYAFEPIPATYNRLFENVRLNHLEDRVNCVNKGVGAEQGSIMFTGGSDTMNHAIAPQEKSDNAIRVPVVTLDAALRGESPSLMKIDVEGFEAPALEGARAILEKTSLHSVIMELNSSGNRYGYDEGKIIGLMAEYGFRTYSYNPYSRTLVSLDGKNHESGNTLFVRDESLVQNRLTSSPKICIHGVAF